MPASLSAHTWIASVALRISASSGSPLAPPKASPCVVDLLDHGHPQGALGQEGGHLMEVMR